MNLSKDDLIDLHRIVQELHKTTPGIRQKGILESIIERPDQILYGKELYPDIYSKSASIMEGIIRLHPFVDGNKRTGLIATQTYLEINGYITIFPIHAVKFSVIIAKTKARKKGEEQQTTDKLIRKISKWLRKYVMKNDDKDKFYKVIKGLKKEVSDLQKMFVYNPQKAERIIDEWLAVDIYPEYNRDTMQMLEFIKLMNRQINNYVYFNE